MHKMFLLLLMALWIVSCSAAESDSYEIISERNKTEQEKKFLPREYNVIIDNHFTPEEIQLISSAAYRWEESVNVKINLTINNFYDFSKITIIKSEGRAIERFFDKTFGKKGKILGIWYKGDIHLLVDRVDAQYLEILTVHEFGHMLGLDHNKDRKSIMYEFIGDGEITEEDKKAFEEKRMQEPNAVMLKNHLCR